MSEHMRFVQREIKLVHRIFLLKLLHCDHCSMRAEIIQISVGHLDGTLTAIVAER